MNERITVDFVVTDLNSQQSGLNTTATLEEKLTTKYIATLAQEDLQRSFAMNVRKINTSLAIIAMYLERGVDVGLGELHAAWKAREQNPDLWQRLSTYVANNGITFTEREAGVYDAVDPDFTASISAAIDATPRNRLINRNSS